MQSLPQVLPQVLVHPALQLPEQPLLQVDVHPVQVAPQPVLFVVLSTQLLEQLPLHPELQLEVQAAEHFPPQPEQFEPQSPPHVEEQEPEHPEPHEPPQLPEQEPEHPEPQLPEHPLVHCLEHPEPQLSPQLEPHPPVQLLAQVEVHNPVQAALHELDVAVMLWLLQAVTLSFIYVYVKVSGITSLVTAVCKESSSTNLFIGSITLLAYVANTFDPFIIDEAFAMSVSLYGLTFIFPYQHLRFISLPIFDFNSFISLGVIKITPPHKNVNSLLKLQK